MSKKYEEWKKAREETAKKGQEVWDELLKETAKNIEALNELKPKDIKGAYRLSLGLHNVDMDTGKPQEKAANALVRRLSLDTALEGGRCLFRANGHQYRRGLGQAALCPSVQQGGSIPPPSPSISMVS